MCCRRLTKAKSGGLACHPAVPQHAVLGEGLRQTIRKVHTCNEAHGGCCLGERQMTPETTTPRTCSSWAGWKTAAPCKCRWAAMPSLHATSAGKHIQSTHLFHIPVRNACGAQHKATGEASGHTCSLAAGLRPTCSCACAARLDPCPAHPAAGCPPTAWRQTWWPASLQRSESGERRSGSSAGGERRQRSCSAGRGCGAVGSPKHTCHNEEQHLGRQSAAVPRDAMAELLLQR